MKKKIGRLTFSSLCLCVSVVILFFPSKFSFSQIIPPDEDQKQDILEQRTEQNETGEVSYENYLDLESALANRPVNLNKANREELQPLVEMELLSDIQANSIIQYRDQLGLFISELELQAVPYLDVETIKAILSYIKITSDITDYKVKASDLFLGGDYFLMFRSSRYLEEQKGFSPPDASSTSRYLGSPYSLYARFRHSYGTRLSYGITAQKDAGEEFFGGSQKRGFDFYSAHFYMKGNGFIQAVALGDYEIKFGQGLIAASGFGVGKSSYVMSIKQGGRTLRAYTSVNEYNFFRGGAVVVGNKFLNVTGFFSYKPIDANIGTIDTIEENLTVTSIGGDGLHRTESEVSDRNAINQTVFGGNADVFIKSLKLGLSAIQTQLSSPIVKDFQPYNQFDFSGDQLTNAALHYDWQYRNFNLFGEGAWSDNGGKALLSGLLLSVDPRVDVGMIYRNYESDFQSLYANAFAESSTANNEEGLYTGITIRPVYRWKIDAYADFFHKSWLDYQVDAPSDGNEYFIQLTYKPNKVLEIYGRFKSENKMTNSSLNDEALDYVVPTQKKNLRLNLSYKVTPTFTLKSRAEWVFYDEESLDTQHGYLLYQDIVFRKLGFPLQLTTRFCLFDAETYDARIYAYENDVLYAYSIPEFHNRGMRYYLLARWTIINDVDLWVRYAQTYYTNIDVIGSGLDEIDGNTRSEVKAEVRFKF